jgi:hypothetical protein
VPYRDTSEGRRKLLALRNFLDDAKPLQELERENRELKQTVAAEVRHRFFGVPVFGAPDDDLWSSTQNTENW